MKALIWSGAALTVIGIAALLWCIALVLRIRKNAPPEAEARASLQRVVVINMGALAISAIGLMMVVIGVILD
jgi:hypothetical protein